MCYVAITDHIMASLPKSADGHFLVPPPPPQTPFSLTLEIMQALFKERGPRGCPHRQGRVM